MIDRSYLAGGFSRIENESPFADFYSDGQLRTFRAGPANAPAKSITLRLEHGRAEGRLERVEVHAEALSDDLDHSSGIGEEEFEDWVRRAIQSVYDLAEGVRRCGFCEKTDAEVAVLIAGPTSYLCDECIRTCMQILDERKS